MIARLLEQEKVIRIVLRSDQIPSHLLSTWQHLDVWSAITNGLSPLEDFIDVISGERYTTGSAVLPITNLLDNEILKEKEQDKTLTNDICLAIKSDLSTRNTNSQVVELLEVC